MIAQAILDAQIALKKARVTLLQLSEGRESRSLDNALNRVDEAVFWTGRIKFNTPRRPVPQESGDFFDPQQVEVSPYDRATRPATDLHPDRDPML